MTDDEPREYGAYLLEPDDDGPESDHEVDQFDDTSDLLDDLALSEGNELESARGPWASTTTNYGQVARHVYGDMVLTINRQVQRFRAYHELSEEYIATIAAKFVDRDYHGADGHVLGYQGVVDVLKEFRSVILLGDPDTGRHTAALRVLSALGLSLHEVTVENPNRTGPWNVSELPSKQEVGYLMELPLSGGTIAKDLARQLDSYRYKLDSINSYIVVIASESMWTDIGGTHERNVFKVDPPDPSRIVVVELSQRAPDRDFGLLLHHDKLVGLMSAASPQAAVRLANLLAATDERASSETYTTDRLLDQVVAAYRDWNSELARWFEHHPSVRERLFLVATAMAEGSPAGLVLRFAGRLGEALEDTGSRHDGIGDMGIRQLAKEVGAVVGIDRRIVFERTDYSDAVLDFVSADRTDGFRRRMWMWAAGLPFEVAPGRQATHRADDLASRMLSAARRNREPGILRYAVGQWSGRKDLQRVAVELLTASALSPEIGAGTRALLNQWATKSADPDLLITIADVCGGPLADSYPEVAFTRLNHLAAKSARRVQDRVASAVIDLWKRPVLRRRLLTLMSGWLTVDGVEPATSTARVASQAMIVLSALDDVQDNFLYVALGLRPSAKDELITCTAGLLTQSDLYDTTAQVVGCWLDMASEDREMTDPLVDLLIRAIPGPEATHRIANLRNIAYAWQPVKQEGDPHRVALRESIVEQLHRVDPTVIRWFGNPAGQGEPNAM